ncbi:MAG: Rv3235 family protein [Candidatus Nanopelagicales bacterium]
MSTTSTLPARIRPIDDFGRQPTPESELGDPAHVSRTIALAVLEVLVGRRPIRQLNGWVSNSTLAQLRAQCAARKGPPAARPPRVGSVHVKQPIDGIVESSIIVCEDGRYRAIAVRLEGLDGRWQCTAFEDQ